MLNKIKILYFHQYGDQHHKSSEKLKIGEKFISDGGSNIHTNFILQIHDNYQIDLHTYKENFQARNFFHDHENICILEHWTLSNFFQQYLLKIETFTRCFYPGLKYLFMKFDHKYLITQTDFLPDTFAGFCCKIRNPKIIWIASYFLEARAPWKQNSPYKGKRWLVGFFYWLQQQPSVWFIKQKADKIMVTSEPDVNKFVNKKRSINDVVVVQGGVNIDQANKHLNSGLIPLRDRMYDACFSGRFHAQKGVIEAIEIWNIVVRKMPKAKLVMIGSGPLETEVKAKIAKYGLENNVYLAGFLSDGEEKFDIFKNSKLIIHPAIFDSGGMAAAEGMAWALPAVSFDLEALKTYYPKGMLKSELNNCQDFANNIFKLLEDKELYKKTALDAVELIRSVWDWEKRAKYMTERLFN
ncbi:hypothetical protein A2533_04405 [Candidatus Falkowbacteria bacterium RIFOXYD2_FULL_35_9]|uniref:Glycosyl transferase family 1 domain-containing protein n=1 Tax=Candidatus Falkowbacteria bacterium RIFOXYC2_FULL_36_12 TaxID=1798002 RepID=A0A1F5T0E9_9BACT|nr:MAG: hypothetical protein A2478_03660 [Candidatus Falkowbacteria bacterium RIFOXYC2_FULL_36_12]OGF34727.1 MAG: hypothetical protein A2223_00895 [Candidatus Falkowbacteria bacterium RIFOXYA2_FULL_35_8]OGF48361.1 MAG: hypothetical protein A2533_04405 [Candidatus Falkowbacteria bacterium RIFOXYD2_FULL_35_9]